MDNSPAERLTIPSVTNGNAELVRQMDVSYDSAPYVTVGHRLEPR